MCGFAGFAGAGDEAVLRAMGEAVAHRGPDGEGVAVDRERGVYLVHRRLAVVDLPGGAQPMWNEDGGVGVVFNGEIYNHGALRAELEALGHTFRTDHSDTEVLVHGYEAWGVALPERLDGMFAFAILDRARSRLFLARDRFGKKPLYYAQRPGLFAFASELTALLRHPAIERRIDRRSLAKLFGYGFIPSPRSLYEGVARLPGGHHLTVALDRPGEARPVKYWEFAIEPAGEAARAAEARWAEELRHLLGQAVRKRLMADVPLGVFLSGGIDSSAVLAFAARAAPERVKTFAIGFREASFDESAAARAVAAAFGAEHRERILDLEGARALVPQVLGRLDEPFGDPSIVPTYQLCAFAREHVTVALGGDGGDELFAGYDPFRALAIARRYHALVPRWMKRGARALAELLPVSQENMGLDFRIKRGLRGAGYPPRLWNPAWLGPLEPAEVADLLGEPVDPDELYAEAIAVWESSRATHLVDKTLEFYTRLYLPDDILVKADRASMMVGLELRSPFLDRDVVEFARRLPHGVKYRRGTTKYLLRRALAGVVPDTVLARPKKGFGIPLTRWLRSWGDEGFSRAAALVANPAWTRARLAEHKAGVRDHRLALWCLLALEHHGQAFA